jgi:hypothetical protein
MLNDNCQPGPFAMRMSALHTGFLHRICIHNVWHIQLHMRGGSGGEIARFLHLWSYWSLPPLSAAPVTAVGVLWFRPIGRASLVFLRGASMEGFGAMSKEFAIVEICLRINHMILDEHTRRLKFIVKHAYRML